MARALVLAKRSSAATAHRANDLPVVRMVALLISLLASGFLTSYALFGHRAPAAPAPAPAVAPAPQPDAAGTWVPVPDVPPINPAERARARAAARRTP
jgi:hypothetical protein